LRRDRRRGRAGTAGRASRVSVSPLRLAVERRAQPGVVLRERLDVLVLGLAFPWQLPEGQLVSVGIAEFRDPPERLVGDSAAELAGFGLSSWTCRSCTRSSPSSERASGCAPSPRRFLPLRECPSRRCPCCSRRCTRSSTAHSCCSRPRTPTRAIWPKAFPGS